MGFINTFLKKMYRKFIRDVKISFLTKYTAMGLIGAIITHFSCQDAERTRTSK
jgi:hypothetical protein